MAKVSGGDRSPLAAASSAIVPICFVGLCFTYVVALAYIPCVVVVVAVVLVVVLRAVLVLVLPSLFIHHPTHNKWSCLGSSLSFSGF